MDGAWPMARRHGLEVTSQQGRDASSGRIKHRESQQKGADAATGMFTARSQCVQEGVGTWCPELLRGGLPTPTPSSLLFSRRRRTDFPPSATPAPKHIIGKDCIAPSQRARSLTRPSSFHPLLHITIIMSVPAFSDIPKSANDVRLRCAACSRNCARPPALATLTLRASASEQGLLPRRCW